MFSASSKRTLKSRKDNAADSEVSELTNLQFYADYSMQHTSTECQVHYMRLSSVMHVELHCMGMESSKSGNCLRL